MALATASASCHTVSADEQTNRSKLSAGGGGARKQYLQLVGGRRRERLKRARVRKECPRRRRPRCARPHSWRRIRRDARGEHNERAPARKDGTEALVAADADPGHVAGRADTARRRTRSVLPDGADEACRRRRARTTSIPPTALSAGVTGEVFW